MVVMPVPDPKGGLILVVDDEPASLRFLTEALEAAGYTVLVATSGTAALDRLGRIVPDLILMDGIMPELDGFETTRRIKAVEAWAAIPVVFMTGLVDSEHAIAAFRLGGADYVRKPINVDELLARVRTHADQGRVMQASMAGLAAAHGEVIATGPDGRFLWCSPSAERFLRRLDGTWAPEGAALPAALVPAVRQSLALTDQPGASIRVEVAGGTVEIAVVARYRRGEAVIRLNEVNPEADAERLRQHLGLTRREAEVLLWISYGKPNRVISEVLGISPRTVHKHLERIFDKLGVETRSAAAATAIRIVDA